jgi:hypothetical protein
MVHGERNREADEDVRALRAAVTSLQSTRGSCHTINDGSINVWTSLVPRVEPQLVDGFAIRNNYTIVSRPSTTSTSTPSTPAAAATAATPSSTSAVSGATTVTSS